MWLLHILFLFLLSECVSLTTDPLPVWPMDRPQNMPQITLLDVMCYTNKMTVTVRFSSPFNGMVFSKGSYGQPKCVYISPNSAQTDYTFDIIYDQCGTKPDLQGKFYENTIVIQYEKDLIELWDEAKRLRCEWANDYRQLTESMPAVKIDDLTVIELNFQGDNVDCWMEIQEGKGPWASHVSGIVPIGSALTLVVAISDPSGEFDMMVRSCVAHDGVKQPLQLTDEKGCILRSKMFSKFFKTRTESGRATAITYAYFSAFKFPDTMQVNIQCKVVICRHGCPKPCSSESFHINSFVHKISPPAGVAQKFGTAPRSPDKAGGGSEVSSRQDKDHLGSDAKADNKPVISARTGEESGIDLPQAQSYFPSSSEANAGGGDDENRHNRSSSHAFPYGPRSFAGKATGSDKSRYTRSVHDDKELKVSYSYQAISRTDLAFAPNATTDTVSVYSGRPYGNGNYGVCLSVPSFGALFASLGMFAITAVLVAVVFGYHYRNLNTKQCGVSSHPLQNFGMDSATTSAASVIGGSTRNVMSSSFSKSQ